MSTSEKRKLIDGRKTSYGNLPDTSEKQPRNEILRFNSVDAQIHLKWRRINVLMAPKKKCFGGKTPGQHILKNGYLLACMSPDEATALAITPPLVIPLSLFGGIFLNSGSIPVYFIWLKYLSWFSYGYEIMIVNQWSSIGEIDCHRQTRANVTCMTGNDIIRTLSYSQDNVPFDFAMLCVLTVVYRTIAYIALNLKSRSKV